MEQKAVCNFDRTLSFVVRFIGHSDEVKNPQKFKIIASICRFVLLQTIEMKDDWIGWCCYLNQNEEI